jgi:putative acyl-CoA dehydrogenase
MPEYTSRFDTHVVTNQPPLIEGYNAFETDPNLSEGIDRMGGEWALESLTAMGEHTGGHALIELGFLANENPPVLKTHDRFGNRIDQVKFHPAWHQLMAFGIQNGIHALPWCGEKKGVHVVRAIKHYLLSQVEAGVGCPLTMTFAAVPVLRTQPDIARLWVSRLCSSHYDPTFAPPQDKQGCIMGMAMTEKQGGSDVRANTTHAVALGKKGSGEAYHLTGHKWFCSAPMADAFLTLAQTDGGLSCFLVPRWLPDGTVNRFFIQRLKDKLGNRSNASSEIEYDRTWAQMVGEPGRGVSTIIEMVNHTRLDCVIGSAALMRQALVQAIHHGRHRAAFGKKLVDQSLMQSVLADLAVESEGATALMLHLAEAYDLASKSPEHRAYARLVSAIGKYWVCKRTPVMVGEAMECLGGAGYVEERIMPRLYREAPLASIWEGSGNVICLDVLRAMKKNPGAVTLLREQLTDVHGQHRTYDKFLKTLKNMMGESEVHPTQARHLVEYLALALQGSLLIQHAPDNVMDAFCHGRIGKIRGLTFGAGPVIAERKEIIDRAFPGV